jgi:hypothetical protein
MKNHLKIAGPGCVISCLPPADEKDNAALSIRKESNGTYCSLQFCSADPVFWGLLHRAVGEFIDIMQPGVASPIPEDSSDLLDAMKVAHEIDRKWREANNETD